MRRLSILLVAILGTFFPANAKESEILWSKRTDWGEIRVRQEGGVRTLMFADEEGETEESRMLLKHPDQIQERYLAQMAAASKVIPPKAEPRWLVVGLGAGSLSRELARVYPQSTVTSIELEPAVVEAAKRFFFYKESEHMITVVDDARHFLETTKATYDGIFLDAFDGVEVPETLRTVEFAELLDRHLEREGAIIANVHFVPQKSSLRYQRSLREVFPEAYLTNGLAQGAGIFAHYLTPPSADLISSDNSGLLLPAAEQEVDSVEPYRDGQP